MKGYEDMNTHEKTDRFKGFADTYDNSRPSCPKVVVDILYRYLGHTPKTVIDLGCGTGLSTLVWKDIAQKIIGVEPSDDMRTVASANSCNYSNIEYRKAFSESTGLPNDCADIVTCSQSFHWMEPTTTLSEINRLLKPGGVFAAYDCYWPPLCSVALEIACNNLFDKMRKIESEEFKGSFIRYTKRKHLENIRNSGQFIYTREIVFMNNECCDPTRFINLILSHNRIQAILKQKPVLLRDDLAYFKKIVHNEFKKDIIEIGFCYKMQIGVKGITPHTFE